MSRQDPSYARVGTAGPGTAGTAGTAGPGTAGTAGPGTAMTAMTIRPIDPAQTRVLRRAVLRPHQSLEELGAHEPPDAFAVGSFEGSELVAVGLIGPEGGPGSWRVRGMATAIHARGRGAGTSVLAALVGHAMAMGATRVWCNARTPARSLYGRAGFRVVSEEFELAEIGPHLVMELVPSSG